MATMSQEVRVQDRRSEFNHIVAPTKLLFVMGLLYFFAIYSIRVAQNLAYQPEGKNTSHRMTQATMLRKPSHIKSDFANTAPSSMAQAGTESTTTRKGAASSMTQAGSVSNTTDTASEADTKSTIASKMKRTEWEAGDDDTTFVQYVDPEAAREAKRIQGEFCESISTALPLFKDIPAGSIHKKQARFRIYHHGNTDAVSKQIERKGTWELQITKNLIKNLEIYAAETQKTLGDLSVVDIGANIGWYTMVIASLGVNVVSFEPMEPNLDLLRRSLCVASPEIRDRVTLFGHGLSEKEQTCFQYVKRSNSGNGHTRCVEKVEDLELNLDEYKVVGRSQLRVLDNIIRTVPKSEAKKEPISIAALKIDTEGFEPIIFNGGHALLSQAEIPVIFTEYAPRYLRRITPGMTGFDYLKYFYDNGYVIYNKNSQNPWTLLTNMTAARAHTWTGETDIIAVHESFLNVSSMASIRTLPPKLFQ